MKKTILRFQAFVLPLLLLGLAGYILETQGYDLLINGRLLLREICLGCFVAGVLLEAIMLLVITVRTKKLILILLNVVVIPCVLTLLFLFGGFVFLRAIIFGGSEIYHFEEFDKDIVVYNQSLLLAGQSNIYETSDGILVRYVAMAGGDDGYMPLQIEDAFSMTPSPDGLLIEYHFCGPNDSKDYDYNLYLKYEDGHFVKDYQNWMK